ncbi:MAG: hypothetical protein DI533_15430 [Cereibacter sphaeroides]|uniref:ABC transporter domain-containing protein n=1 Tax=Cereibacter sphaeroides TaxID=1063 RepID=A0A2W5SA58_CERSP|nr:MAG: hypothetical protein DI533_15430 [Cereibacter sphaeroides]
MTELVLNAENVSKPYLGVCALNQVLIDCRAGEVDATLGENASGKSSLMKIARGAVAPNSGTVTIAGQPLTHPDQSLARSLGLATIYQDGSLVCPSHRALPWRPSCTTGRS